MQNTQAKLKNRNIFCQKTYFCKRDYKIIEDKCRLNIELKWPADNGAKKKYNNKRRW